eukprot:12249188-Alexandrium_andersonii.AAC.1
MIRVRPLAPRDTRPALAYALSESRRRNVRSRAWHSAQRSILVCAGPEARRRNLRSRARLK